MQELPLLRKRSVILWVINDDMGRGPKPYEVSTVRSFLRELPTQHYGISLVTDIEITRAHVARRPTLKDLLLAYKSPEPACSVALYSPDTKEGRAFTFTWRQATWLPLDLNTHEDGVAMDRVLLHNVDIKEARQLPTFPSGTEWKDL